MKNWRIVALILLCLVLVGLVACTPFGDVGQEEVSQQLVEVVRGDLTVSISGSGTIDVSQDARLTFSSNGRVGKIFVNEDDEVSEGEVLAKLETDPFELALTQAQVTLAQARVTRAQVLVTQAQAQAALAQAQIALDAAEDNLDKVEDYLERLRKYFSESNSKVEKARSQLETAELQLEAAEAQLEAAEFQLEAAEPQLETADFQLKAAEQALGEAQKQLDRTTLTAPFDGIIVSVDIDEGDTVSVATSIIHLIDLSSMELKAGVDEIDIASVKLNQRALISVDAFPDLQLEGEVSSISLMPTVEAGLVIYDVTISFNVPEDVVLRVGMSATADIIINERSNVLLVPNKAIKKDSEGNSVVKIMVDEQIQERPVVIGISDGYQTEIVSGLDEGETVVIESRAKTESSQPGGFLFGR